MLPLAGVDVIPGGGRSLENMTQETLLMLRDRIEDIVLEMGSFAAQEPVPGQRPIRNTVYPSDVAAVANMVLKHSPYKLTHVSFSGYWQIVVRYKDEP